MEEGGLVGGGEGEREIESENESTVAVNEDTGLSRVFRENITIADPPPPKKKALPLTILTTVLCCPARLFFTDWFLQIHFYTYILFSSSRKHTAMNQRSVNNCTVYKISTTDTIHTVRTGRGGE